MQIKVIDKNSQKSCETDYDDNIEVKKSTKTCNIKYKCSDYEVISISLQNAEAIRALVLHENSLKNEVKTPVSRGGMNYLVFFFCEFLHSTSRICHQISHKIMSFGSLCALNHQILLSFSVVFI